MKKQKQTNLSPFLMCFFYFKTYSVDIQNVYSASRVTGYLQNSDIIHYFIMIHIRLIICSYEAAKIQIVKFGGFVQW